MTTTALSPVCVRGVRESRGVEVWAIRLLIRVRNLGGDEPTQAGTP